MPIYSYRCPECSSVFESVRATERLACCRKPGCLGTPERIPGVVSYPSLEMHRGERSEGST